MIPRHVPLALAAVLAVWCSSCRTTGVVEAPAPASSGSEEADDEEGDEPDDEEDRALELRKAEVNLELTSIGVEMTLRGARAAVADAERELDEAVSVLQVFDERRMPRELDEAQLGLDRALHRRELQADELGELEAMYAEEDFAQKTKELVLKRGRKNLEFAERALVLAQLALASKKEIELPLERRELDVAVQKAERALVDARDELRKAELEGEVDLLEARHELDELERDEEADEEAG